MKVIVCGELHACRAIDMAFRLHYYYKEHLKKIIIITAARFIVCWLSAQGPVGLAATTTALNAKCQNSSLIVAAGNYHVWWNMHMYEYEYLCIIPIINGDNLIFLAKKNLSREC